MFCAVAVTELNVLVFGDASGADADNNPATNKELNILKLKIKVAKEEVLKNNEILFEAKIVQIEDLENCFGHITFDAKGEKYTDLKNNFPNILNQFQLCIYLQFFD